MEAEQASTMMKTMMEVEQQRHEAANETMAAAPFSNQETENAAMLMTKCGEVARYELPQQFPTTTNTTATTTITIKLDDTACFAVPAAAAAATPLKSAATRSACSSRSSSLKKQRRSANGNASGSCPRSSCQRNGSDATALPVGEMKMSQSMTSLPADEQQQQRRDVIQAKLHMERPYNSLKKNAHCSNNGGTQGGGAGKTSTGSVGNSKCLGSSNGGNHNNKMHRYSWGSGHSHSSSTSLHSSATLGLGTSGKDDLWAAIQTNYNYIMDTNLLDTCKEARCEIEGAATVLEKSNECCFKMLDETQRNEGLCEDPKELRRWLREMEHQLENSPTISELTLFSNAELQRHLSIYSVLYHEIVSHARVVSACIRAASEREQSQSQSQQQPTSLTSNCSSSSTSEATKSSSTSSGFASADLAGTTTTTTATAITNGATAAPKKGEGNLERLRDRYHLLYLKAFEVQICLDNLLLKRSSTATSLNDDEDDDDEDDEDEDSDESFDYEGVATEDDLNDVASDLELESENAAIQHTAAAAELLQRCHVTATEIVKESKEQQQPRDCIAIPKHVACEDADDADQEDEDYDDDDDDRNLHAAGVDVVDFVIAKRAWRKPNNPTAATLTDFEADSESSDWEHLQQLRRQRRAYNYTMLQQQAAAATPTLSIADHHVNMSQSSASTPMHNSVAPQQQQHFHLSAPMLQTRHNNKMLPQQMLPVVGSGGGGGGSGKPKSIAVAVITPNSHSNTNSNHSKASPTVLRKHRHNDTSKFNRSNRKSKNCAIFYFKHLDTDNETSGAGTDDGHSHHNHAAGACDDADVNVDAVNCSQASDILKSADATTDDDDDEGWLYTAATAAGAAAAAVNGNSTLNSTIVFVDGLQSAAVSSTTSIGAGPSTAAGTSDDSDKENKEALAASTTVSAATTASSSGSSSSPATTVAIAATLTASSNCDSSSRSHSSNSGSYLLANSYMDSSATSQITQMPRMDMELHVNGNASADNSSCYSKSQQQCDNNNLHNNNNINNNNNNQQSRLDFKQQQQMGVDLLDHVNIVMAMDNANGNANTNEMDLVQQTQSSCYYSRADICNISVRPSEMSGSGSRLPPRSPAKPSKTPPMSKGKVSSHDSIKQLVREAEHLVRDAQEAALKTPTKQKHSIVKISSTVKKREVSMPGPIKQRVEEWLEHQPSTPQLLGKSHEPLNGHAKAPDDCEASGEASETDSIPQPGGGSDTSEGFTDSIATCMQTSTNSYGNSTERIGGSAEPIGQAVTPLGYGSSNQSLNVKIVKRPQTRRKSERPWSVSCLSQLTTDAVQLTTSVVVGQNAPTGLATHSISESALDSLSPGPRARAASSSGTGSNAARKADSKGSLRRRRARKKRMSAASAGKKSDSGSEANGDLTQTLMKSCESMSSQQLQEFTNALLSIQKVQSSTSAGHSPASKQLNESGGEEQQLMLPKFRVGSYTTALMAGENRLGALAALSNYMHEDEQQAELSTEDHHSSISETAWDNYQEKYNSENYSEGFDSDAARRLLEFGDDYRNFIDSQSDCCSSLSAANNLDSYSPPRMDSLQQHELKALHINQETISSSVDHARRQRVLELQYERRRKTLEVRRKSCQDVTETANPQQQQQQQQQLQQQQSLPGVALSASASALTSKTPAQVTIKAGSELVGRKLEFGGHMSHSAQSLLRRTSESDTSTRRRRTVTADERRRSSRNLEKCIKLIPATSSSSGDDSDGEQEMRSLLQQTRDRLEETRALKIRCHLLRPEDYNEIINTCRDNIRCLEAVLRGPPGTVLSAQCAGQTKDLLAAWEDLLGWSENAAAARKLQQDMSVLKHMFQRLGNKPTFELLDTEPAIQVAIEALKHEQIQLNSHRTNMLRLNASVHSWLTRQERRLQNAQAEQQQQQQHNEPTTESEQPEPNLEQAAAKASGVGTIITVTDSNGNQVVAATAAEAGTSTERSTAGSEKMWDVDTLLTAEQEFHKHLKNEVSDMYTAWDEADARINTQLEVLTNSLIAWRQLECGLSEFQLALGQDRGTLKGLEGALDKGQATAVELAQNVKLVAKLLSEKVNVSQEQLLAVQEHLDPNHIYHIAKFTASNGSLSDSGISDGGATSDGGLSERERRLGVLRRLAKQLESALAPGSEAMRSIAARMECAEADLKQLQNTCRDLIVRTAASHQSKKQQQDVVMPRDNGYAKANGHATGAAKKHGAAAKQANSSPHGSPSKRKSKRKQRLALPGSGEELAPGEAALAAQADAVHAAAAMIAAGGDGGDPSDDPAVEYVLDSSDSDDTDEANKSRRRGWAWRIAKAAVPMQLALFTFFCAACLMQPNCCDNLNNLSMSFTPQLRYIRGPPPI